MKEIDLFVEDVSLKIKERIKNIKSLIASGKEIQNFQNEIKKLSSYIEYTRIRSGENEYLKSSFINDL